MFTHNRIPSCHTHLTYVTQPLSENLRVGEKRNRMNTVTPIVLFSALDFKSFTVTQLNSIFVSLPISQDGELNLGWAMGLSCNHFFPNVPRFLGWGPTCKFWLSVCNLSDLWTGEKKKKDRKPFPMPALSNGIFCWKWQKRSLSEQSNTIVRSQRWLLSTWNAARTTVF